MTEQARTLKSFAPRFLVRQQLAPSVIPCQAIDGAWRRRMFALVPGAWAFGGRQGLHDLSLLHAHFGPNGVYALPLRRALDIPLVVTFHGFDATVNRQDLLFRRGLFGLRYLAGFPRLKRETERVIAVSEFLRDKLLAMGMPEHKLVQHYIGVDLNRFKPLPEVERSLDIVCVGRLVYAKGIADLIEAFALVAPFFPETRLRLVGEGPDRTAFETLVAERGLVGRVVFEGTMPHDRVAALVSRCAISALASRTGVDGWQEAFGLASIEAAAAGLPVIVTRHGGLPETVLDGQTGLVVREGQVRELAGALQQLLTDESLRSRMGAAARLHVATKFNLQSQTFALEGIYREAMAT